ncbi:MAG TPA: metallophosphoesterase [Anaerolineales bacterium]
MNNPKLSRRSFLKIMGLLAGEAFLIGAGGMVYTKQLEPSWVEITQVGLNLPRLGKAFEGFRLVQVSDIHMGGWMNVEHFSYVMKLALNQGADLLALTGDFVNYQGDLKVVAGAIEDLSEVFKTLGDVARVGVLGNHDHRTAPDEIRKMMEKHQIMDLTNNVHTIVRGVEYLHIAGVDDMRRGKPDLNKVVTVLPKDGSAILLSHEPDFADKSAQTGRFDLQISGHSHGGQVVLPFVGPPYLPPGGQKYYDGLYQVGTMLQYTNRGVGMIAPFIRFNCRPEITVFTLQVS